MKSAKLIQGFVVIGFLLISAGCGEKGKKQESPAATQQAALVEVSIGGMSCTGCEQTVQNKLSKLEGVTYVKASFTDGKAVVEYIPSVTDTLKIREAIASTGYTCKKINSSTAQ